MPGAGSERLPKKHRVLDRETFKRVYEQGCKVHARYFTAFTLPNSEGHPRIGITATRKTGKSVGRNRARRLVREVFRKNKWLVKSGVDIVINVKHPLVDAAYHDLEGDFIAFLEKVSKK